MLLPSPTTPTNCHPSWDMEGTNVLDTEILHRTKPYNGKPMAFPLSLEPRSTRRVGALQDPGIHGTTWDPPIRRGKKNRTKLRKDIEEYHLAYGIDFVETDIDTFISRRPDGLAFDKEKNCVCSQKTPEQWTPVRIRQRRRSRRKTTDTAHTEASSAT